MKIYREELWRSTTFKGLSYKLLVRPPQSARYTLPMIPIFDGHNDTLLSLTSSRGEGRSFFERSPVGHIDLPRALEGGLAGGFFAIFVPKGDELNDDNIVLTDKGYRFPLADPIDLEAAQRGTGEMMRKLFELEKSEKLQVVRTVGALEKCLNEGVLAAILHFEGAEALGGAGALENFYNQGLRSLGLVWSRHNQFGHGVPFEYPASPDTGPGLTDEGKELVKECNRLGVMIDLSHLSEKGFWDVAELSNAPLVATHSNAHALSPVTRNLTDGQLSAIRESDGMVGVNFAVSFLRADGARNADTTLETVVRHFDYLIDRLGVDRVGFGSDFDGATIPYGIRDVSGLPNLLEVMRAHGYDDATLRKLGYENWLRVLRKTWRE